MSKKVDVSQAQLKTVNIEIKAITLNNKQMTLAVYKQLKQEDLIEWTLKDMDNSKASLKGALKGIPWGIVNYCADCSKETKEEEHFHVIWQKGKELRRCTILKEHEEVLKFKLSNRLLSLARGRKQISFNSSTYADKVLLELRKLTGYSVHKTSSLDVFHNIPDEVLIKEVERLTHLQQQWETEHKKMYDQLAEIDQLFIAV